MSSVQSPGVSTWDEEDAIWQEVLLGSRPAFMQLLGLSLRPMLNYYERAVPSMVRHLIDPNDLRQQACVQIVAGFEAFRPATLGAYHVWRKRVEHCVLARALRECGAHEEGCAVRPGRLDERAIDEGRQRAFVPGRRSPLDAMALDETDGEVQAAIDRLPDADRQLFVWHACEGVSFAEIGHRLGMSEDSAWRRYRKIRQQLSRSVADKA